MGLSEGPTGNGAQVSCLPVPCSLGEASGSPRADPGAGAEADFVQTLWSHEFGEGCSQHCCLGPAMPVSGRQALRGPALRSAQPPW